MGRLKIQDTVPAEVAPRTLPMPRYWYQRPQEGSFAMLYTQGENRCGEAAPLGELVFNR